MKIGMVLERDFPTTPPDIRVEKEMRSLTRAGHEVELLSLQLTSTLRKALFEERIPIFRVPIEMLRIKDWDRESVERHFHSPLSPWVQAVDDFLRHRHVDVLHVHDLPLAWTCAHAGSRREVPVVLDMHEVYPDLVRFMRSDATETWSPSEWVAQYERECLERVERLIVTVEESRRRLTRMSIPEEKISVVMNTEEISNMKPSGEEIPYASRLQGKCVVTYVGAFGEVRGLESLIRAMGRLANCMPEMHLLLVGGGYNERELEDLVREHHLEGRVTMTGWVLFRHIPDLIALSDICVVPHLKNPFTDTTVPHKLFQYMLLGKPVVVSDAAPLLRIVRECRCGMAFPSGQVDVLVRCLERLARDPEERRRLGENGRKAALKRYHWGTEEKALQDLYHRLGGREAQGPQCPCRE